MFKESLLSYGINHAMNLVKRFHSVFNHPVADKPTAMSLEQAQHRVNYKAEELVEFLHASARNSEFNFRIAVDELIYAIDLAMYRQIDKEITYENEFDVLVAQADALTDEVYFASGDFTILGISNPQKLFDIVQDANMSKLFPDGKPRYDENNGGKIIKPEGWTAPEPKLRKAIEDMM